MKMSLPAAAGCHQLDDCREGPVSCTNRGTGTAAAPIGHRILRCGPTTERSYLSLVRQSKALGMLPMNSLKLMLRASKVEIRPYDAGIVPDK